MTLPLLHRPPRALLVLSLPLVTLPALQPAPATADGGRIEVVVHDVESDEGHVRCGLFDSEDAWLEEDETFRSASTPAREGRVLCAFEDVPPGRYAASGMHDEDDDGEIDKTLGIPSEGYFATRDAHREGVGAPDWDDASFSFDGSRRRTHAHMKY